MTVSARSAKALTGSQPQAILKVNCPNGAREGGLGHWCLSDRSERHIPAPIKHHQSKYMKPCKNGQNFFKNTLTHTGVLLYDIKAPVRVHSAMMREIAVKTGNFRGVCP